MVRKNKVAPSEKSLEQWIWDAACAIRGAKDAGKFKDYILPLIFVKRLCDVFDDEVTKIAKTTGSRKEALKRIDADHSRVRFYLSIRAKDPETQDTWSVIRSLSNNIGEELTRIIRDIATYNSLLDGVIDTVDYNATTRGQREIDDDRLSNLIEAISQKKLGLNDVEPDIIGRSYEYLIRKFAEGSGQSAGEFYTPREVGILMARIMDAEPGMEVYDPTCGSAGLLIKCELVLKEKQDKAGKKTFAPLKLYGQEYTTTSWAMAKMNMIIHDMEGDIELGDTFNNPKFKDSTGRGIRKFDRSLANPMWNQPDFNEEIYINDVYHRFPAGSPGNRGDWGWVQHIFSSLKDDGKAAIVLDTGAASRGSGNGNANKERAVRKWFVDNDLIESVILLPENVFYNTPNMGLIFVLNKRKKNIGQVTMIDISECFERRRPKNFLTEEGILLAVKAVKLQSYIENISSVVKTSEIAKPENDYNLLPNRYITRTIKAGWEERVYRRFDTAARSFEKQYVYKLLAEYFEKQQSTHCVNDLRLLAEKSYQWESVPLSKFLTASEVCVSDAPHIESPVVLSLSKNSGLIAQKQRFNQKIALDDVSKYKIVNRGDLVYNPMVIWEGAIHLLYDHKVGVVSPAYMVWTIKDIDPYFLDFILKTPSILDEYRRLSSGGVNRRRIVSPEDFLSIKIPVPTSKEMTRVKKMVENNLEMYRKFISHVAID